MIDPRDRARTLAQRQRITDFAVQAEARYHEARILILVNAFSRQHRGMAGLEMLARTDFLLRFPKVLDYVEQPELRWPRPLAATQAERRAYELWFASARYGRWTNRYAPVMAALLARGLISASPAPKVYVCLPRGSQIATRLAASGSWQLTAARAAALDELITVDATQLDHLVRPAIGLMSHPTAWEPNPERIQRSEGAKDQGEPL